MATEIDARKELEALSDEQILALLDLSHSQAARTFPGAAGNKSRKLEHAPLWMSHAGAKLKESPALIFDIPALAKDVATWCNASGIRKKNGTPYKLGTIYRHLLENKSALLAGAGVRVNRL